MEERTSLVTMHGKPVILTGTLIGVGDKAPEFTVVDQNLNEVSLKDYSGKVKVISVTPSLDTPVCDIQARRFNHEAASFPSDVVVLNISMDLPFAIARFCSVAEIDRVHALSDHKYASFGNAYGLLINELRLLARAIFIIGKDDIVYYREIVPEITDHPDYDRALEALRRLTEFARAA